MIGEYLSHLSFDDDILSITSFLEKLQVWINELKKQSNEIRLKLNLRITNIISSNQPDDQNTPKKIDENIFE